MNEPHQEKPDVDESIQYAADIEFSIARDANHQTYRDEDDTVLDIDEADVSFDVEAAYNDLGESGA